MSNKLISEMFDILGKANAPAPDPTQPRDVIGAFAVKQDLSVLDEAVLESVGQLAWEDVFDVAMLGTIDPSDFKVLEDAYSEGIPEFRETWQTLSYDNALAPGLDRGAFVMLAKICPVAEARSRFVEWCVRLVQEADETVHAQAVEHSGMFAGLLVPTAPNCQSINGTYKPVASGDESAAQKAKNLRAIDDAEAAMDRVAAKVGKPADELFLNQKIDLDRDRIKNK